MNTPTREDFERECQIVEGLMTAIKRKKDLKPLSVDELVEEYLTVNQQYQRLDDFRWFHSKAIWGWGFEGSKKVHQRYSRQRLATMRYVWSIKDELVVRGEPGMQGIKRMFMRGDTSLTLRFVDEAAEYFPDEAEPVLVALLERPEGDKVLWTHHRWHITELLEKIRGYRQRRATAFAPVIDHGEEIGLAPSLKPVDKSPLDFPEKLLERLALNILVGQMERKEAVLGAWRAVAEAERLDPAEVEKAELGQFDFTIRRELEGAIGTFFHWGDTFEKGIDNSRLATKNLAFEQADGTPVTAEQIREALLYVLHGYGPGPYLPAAAWRRVR